MSKAGAVAVRTSLAAATTASEIAEVGVHEAALIAWQRRDAEAVDLAKREIVRETLRLGLPEAEPFVLDDFLDTYQDHERVCVKYGDLTINYYAKHGRDISALQIVAGRCTKCDARPCLLGVESFADLAKPQLRQYQRLISEYECSRCTAT